MRNSIAKYIIKAGVMVREAATPEGDKDVLLLCDMVGSKRGWPTMKILEVFTADNDNKRGSNESL